MKSHYMDTFDNEGTTVIGTMRDLAVEVIQHSLFGNYYNDSSNNGTDWISDYIPTINVGESYFEVY